MTTTGAVYVAYGESAREEALESIASFRRFHDLPVLVLSDRQLGNLATVTFQKPGFGARWAKLNINMVANFDRILYFDADTRIKASLEPVLEILNDFDLLLSPSSQQDQMLLHHIGEEERQNTLWEIGNPKPVQLQAGVMFFNRLACFDLFHYWRLEWLKYKSQDQAALLRALYQSPVKVWLLSQAFNHRHGEVIEHLFGRARRKVNIKCL